MTRQPSSSTSAPTTTTNVAAPSALSVHTSANSKPSATRSPCNQPPDFFTAQQDRVRLRWTPSACPLTFHFRIRTAQDRLVRLNRRGSFIDRCLPSVRPPASGLTLIGQHHKVSLPMRSVGAEQPRRAPAERADTTV